MRGLLIALLALQLGVFTPLHAPRAEESGNPLPAPSGEVPLSGDLQTDFDRVCGETIKKSQQPKVPGQPELPTQKLQQCQAAVSSKEGADADDIVWKVWTAVASVCGVACVASFFADLGNLSYVCTGATVAGGITDAAVTKQFAGVLAALGTAAASVAMSSGKQAGEEAGKKAGEKGGSKDIGACLSAASASVQAYMKHKGMEDNQRVAAESIKQANLFNSQQFAADPFPSAPREARPNELSAGQGTGTSGVGQNVALGTSTDGSSKTSCSGVKGSGDIGAVVSCATARDGNLPAFVRDERFHQELAKNTGLNLAQLADHGGSPEQLLAAGLTSGVGSGLAGKLTSAIDDLKSNLNLESSGASYSGGGSGARSGSGDGAGVDPALAELMAGLMGQLNPGKKDGKDAPGIAQVVFANQKRSPAAVAEDKTLSIFDRVTYRYYFVGRKMIAASLNKRNER